MFEINQGSHNILKGEVQQHYNYFETTEGIFGIISSNTNWQMLFLMLDVALADVVPSASRTLLRPSGDV
jgi:hypothetical protein